MFGYLVAAELRGGSKAALYAGGGGAVEAIDIWNSCTVPSLLSNCVPSKESGTVHMKNVQCMGRLYSA